MFYWYFPQSSGPLVLWLQGGPGASSMMGALYELGPVALDPASMKLERRPVSWGEYPLLFLDSPVGSGYSFARSKAAFAHNSEDAARDLATALAALKAKYPLPDRLVIAGESYGGHYLPALGAHILSLKDFPFQLEAVLIGDGMTDPAVQVRTKPSSAFTFGLIDEAQLAQAQAFADRSSELAKAGSFEESFVFRQQMEHVVKNASGINEYDVRTTVQYTWQEARLAKFLNQEEVQKMFHAEVPFPANKTKVKKDFKNDRMRNKKPEVEKILAANVTLLLYQGQFDWKDGYTSNEPWIAGMRWHGAEAYKTAKRTQWRRAPDDELAGYWRSAENLHQVLVLGAGHMAPMNQPANCLDMVRRVIGPANNVVLV